MTILRNAGDYSTVYRHIVPGDMNLQQKIFQNIMLFFISRALLGLDIRVYGYDCEIFVVYS
jgi:hypothetical protein